MEEVFDALKCFIENNLPAKAAELADAETPMPAISRIVFGVVDASRVDGKITCVIVPEEEEEEEASQTKGRKVSTVTVSFICKGNKYDVLLRQMCRYAKAFEETVRSDWNLDGAVNNTVVTHTDFFPDAGATAATMTACETQLRIWTERDMDVSVDPFD